MSTNLYDASRQWAERPADQRYWTLAEMYQATKRYADSAAEATVKMGDLSLVPTPENDLTLLGKEGQEAKLTHWSFGQLCQRSQAPASYLRNLPAPLAAHCLNHGLEVCGDNDVTSKVLFHRNGSLICRAFTGEGYARIWNHDVAARLLALEDQGWRVPPGSPALPNQPGTRPATEADVLTRKSSGGGLSINVGDLIAPAGIYASDHDLFAFMVNENVVIEDGTSVGLARGFFVSNSEVGAAAFKIKRFLYRHVCGNHIVWDVKDVQELRIVHTGTADQRFGSELRYELIKYANESTGLEQERITKAKGFILGKDKEEVLDSIFKLRVLPRKTIEEAYDAATMDADLRGTNPRSAWGITQGLTSISQKAQFAEDRVALDLSLIHI